MKQQGHLPLAIILVVLSILGFIVIIKSGFIPVGLDIIIISLIVIAGIFVLFQAIQKHKNIKQGLPVEDELSVRIKHMAGYYAFITSMYMWLLIFIFRNRFQDVETMIGGGILCSSVLTIFIKLYLKKHYHENQD